MVITNVEDSQIETLVRTLEEQGMTDVLVLEEEKVKDVLKDRRQELIRELKDTEDASVTELANRLNRDKDAVSRDLSLLFEYDIIAYRESGEKETPYLKHETVLYEPLFSA